ncbi:type VI secretion system accessory protein TagJ [soil metagenome]
MTTASIDLASTIAAGDLNGALTAAQAAVRKAPADVKPRIALFQLLCVLGQWERAATQLEVVGTLDDAALAMVATYREAIRCEVVRANVYAGKSVPIAFGEPQPWLAWMVEALHRDARGESQAASDLRAQALEAAPTSSGTLDGNRFEWIADADTRLGPVIEAIVNGRYVWMPVAALTRVAFEPPVDLRDFVWTAAQFEFVNGGDAFGLIPTRYAGTETTERDDLRLARATDWPADGQGGLGQRLFATDADEYSLLDLRDLRID